MRNVLLVSLLFAAISCDRDNTTTRNREPIPPSVALPDEPTREPEKQVAPDTTAPANPSAATETPGTTGATADTIGATGTAGSTDPWDSPSTVPAPDTATATTGPSAGTAGSRESGTPSGGYTGGPDQPIETVAKSGDHALSCEQLIPRAVQELYLANMTITPTANATDLAVNCRIEGAGIAEAASAQAWCNPAEQPKATHAAPTSTPEKSTSIGKAAILVDAGELQQLVAWDNDSNCQITLEVPKTVDAVALGRRMLEALPAKSG